MQCYSSTLGHTTVLGNNGKTSSGKTTTFEVIKALMLKNEASSPNITVIEDLQELNIKDDEK